MSKALRVLHGGSWNNNPRSCRSVNRYRCYPNSRANYYRGFRVVCSAKGKKE